MANIYTPQTGWTVPGQQAGNLMDTISGLPLSQGATSAISGYQSSVDQAANLQQSLPAYTQQQVTGQQQAAGLPQQSQAYGEMADLYKMFVADHGLAQKYANPAIASGADPSTYQPSDTPIYGSVGLPQLPVMTLGNVNQPFNGFTDPSMAQAAESGQATSILDTLNNMGALIDYNANVARTNATANVGAYKGLIDSALTRASGYTNLLGIIQNMTQNPVALNQEVMNDAQSGSTLKDLILKYGSRMKKSDILQSYNASGGPYGPAKENRQELSQMGFTQKEINDSLPKLSTADEAKATNLRSTLETIDNLQVQLQSNRSLQKVIGNPLAIQTLDMASKVPGGLAMAQKMLGLDDQAVRALSEFITLQGQGERDMIGGRLSGYMLNVFGKAFPSMNQALSANGALLSSLKSRITNSADIYSQNNGFGTWQNLPGFEDYQDPTEWEVVHQ